MLGGGGRWKEKERSNRDASKCCINRNNPALKAHLYESFIHTTDRAKQVGNIHNVVSQVSGHRLKYRYCAYSRFPLSFFVVLAMQLPSSRLLMLFEHPCYSRNGPAIQTTISMTTHAKATGSSCTLQASGQEVQVFCSEEHTNERQEQRHLQTLCPLRKDYRAPGPSGVTSTMNCSGTREGCTRTGLCYGTLYLPSHIQHKRTQRAELFSL